MPGEGKNERIGRIQYLVSLEGHKCQSSARERIMGNMKGIMLPSHRPTGTPPRYAG